MKPSPLSRLETHCPSDPRRGPLDIEVYADDWEAFEVERARVMEEIAESEAEDEGDEAAIDRLGRLEDERDAALEAFERAVEPYLKFGFTKRKRRVAA